MHTRQSSGDRFLRYIGGLVIGQGRHAGQPFDVLPWQKRFITGAFRQPDDAALSLGRGGGRAEAAPASYR